jgi:tetratricopeptide (TPR) repeat protein
MKLGRWVGIALWIYSISLYAQSDLPENLTKQFENVPHDSIFIDQLNVIAFDNLKTNSQSARQLSTYAQRHAQALKYTKGYARALAITGSTYWYEGVYEIAQSYYLAAARQYSSINDSVGIGQMYNNIGEVYKKLGQFDKSLEYQLLSLDLKKSDLKSQRLTLYNIGEIYIGLKDYDKALDYLNRALDMAKLTNDKRVIAYCYWSYGIIRADQKKYTDAIGFYLLSEKLWAELGEKRSLIQTYQDFALAYQGLKKFERANEYLTKAQTLIIEIRAKDLQARNYLYRFKLDSAQQNFEKAINNLYQYNLLNDSLYRSSKSEQINKLQTIYETENRERENEELRSETTIRSAEIRSQRIIIIAIGLGLFLSSILLIMVFLQRQRILNVNKQLNDKTEEVQTQAESLLKLNDELQMLNKKLESIVEERTTQVMKQNQRLAEYTFINAHKLRSPVASILGLINLLPNASIEERELISKYLKDCGEDLDKIIREIGRNLEGAIVEKNQN